MTEHNRTSPLVELQGVGIRRGGRWLVQGVDLSVHRGEIVTLIGPNGSGKTTTAKTALGILHPDTGTVRRSSSCSVGYVPQRLQLDWTLPLNVERLMLLTGARSHAEISTTLEQVGIGGLRKSQVRSLSGGEFQRALLARALINKPDFLVLDEPVQGVDFAGEIALFQLIRSVRDRTGCGILLISHDLHTVMSGTDTVVCLNRHVCCRGTPEVVAQSPEYVRLFGRQAAESLAVYRHHHDHVHMPDGSVRGVAQTTGKRPASGSDEQKVRSY